MSERKIHRIITERIALEFTDARCGTAELEADLVFDPADPFAVTMVFRHGPQEVNWTFGRELLVDGLYEPTGDGDVLMWPCLSSVGSAVVIVELRSPDGRVLVQAGARVVATFVERMLAAVPNGHEGAFVDVDGELSRLLAGE